MAKKELTSREKRCQDCACLVEKNGVWCCDECFGQKCNDVDDCPEGIEVEEVEQINENAKSIKVKVGATDITKREKRATPKPKKVSDEKKELFSEIFSNLQGIFGENAKIEKENKLIIVKIGEKKTFKVDVIEQRNK